MARWRIEPAACALALPLCPIRSFSRCFSGSALALGIGFLVGVERGWKHRDAPEGTRAAGAPHARHYRPDGRHCSGASARGRPDRLCRADCSLAGALIAFKVRESQRDNDVSVTGTIAALLVFALGVYAMLGDLRVAAAVGRGAGGVARLQAGAARLAR